MGDDTPLAFLARSPRPVYAYFRQRFAQVTNPPIDSLRESCVVSLHTRLGPWPHLLDKNAPLPGVSLPSPFLSLGQVEALRRGAVSAQGGVESCRTSGCVRRGQIADAGAGRALHSGDQAGAQWSADPAALGSHRQRRRCFQFRWRWLLELCIRLWWMPACVRWRGLPWRRAIAGTFIMRRF